MTDLDQVLSLPAGSWADTVTGMLADRLAGRPDLVVCLPTGSTPRPIYDRLPDALRARQVDLSAATIVALDEYVGLPSDHLARCDVVLRTQLLDRLDVPPRRLVRLEVDALEPETAAAAFDEAIVAIGGLDLVLLGLGRNGHVAMNEPGSTADTSTRVVELAAATRDVAIGYGADPPPTHGLTMGLRQILAAREIWLLATGAGKAAILSRALTETPSAAVPASLLLDHPALHVIVDDAAWPMTAECRQG